MPCTLSREVLDRLLSWLSRDNEVAARKYLEIHQKLTRLFAFKGCNCPEDLADVVIDRVARDVPTLQEKYAHNHVLAFYSYTKFVHLEYLRSKLPNEIMPNPQAVEDVEGMSECLHTCLEKMGEPDKSMLMTYYEFSPGQKTQHRKAMAERFSVAVNALRIKMCRLRAVLKECFSHCMKCRKADSVQ